jgi:RND family efflux transporter MFP subunit
MERKPSHSPRWKRLVWLVLPVLVGIAAIFAAPLIKKPPQKIEAEERPVAVRAIEVAKIDVVPRVVGYGKVEPGRTWEAVAEVAGQVEWISDALKDGQVVTAGSELLRIEDSNYRLALAQAEAALQVSEVKNKTASDALAIARKDLDLLRAEYDRKKALSQKGTVSRATVEAAERQVLGGQTKVQDQENTLALNQAEHKALLAQRDAAKLDLDRTRKIAPFDVRISTVNIGVAQYANKGQLLFSADGLDEAEIAAQFPVGILRPLIGALETSGRDDLRQGALGLQAVVRLRTATHMVEWPARISHVGATIDPQTQSLGVVVAVDRPYAKAQPGERPPLLRNTFVEVELASPPLEDQVVVPLNALHDDFIYVVDNDSRLAKRKVTVRFAQNGYALLDAGVEAGDRIVTSDLVSAVEGMLLAPQEDKKTRRVLILAATGKEPGK